MLFFCKRVELASRFLKWARDNGVAEVPENMVAFLQIKGLIDEDKAMAYLKEEAHNEQYPRIT